jgi:hypothetical protein
LPKEEKEMATELKKVEPGDLIEAELMNLIINHLKDLSAAVSGLGWAAGSVTVPNLFGRTLSSAQLLISEPQVKLKLGNTVDAFGAALNPGLSTTKQKIVIGQVPTAGARVAVNSTIDVLLSAQPEAGTGPTPTQESKITGFNPAKTPIGEKVTIFGVNFDVDPAKNKVTFADTPATAPEKGGTTELLVRIPSIPNPPSGSNEKKVSVIVETPAGKATGETILLPPLEGPAPELTSIKGADPDVLVVGEIATIVGKNFSTKLQENSVTFGTTTTGLETAGNSNTTLKVKVPELPGLASGQFRFVDIFVTVAGRQSNLIKNREVDKL